MLEDVGVRGGTSLYQETGRFKVSGIIGTRRRESNNFVGGLYQTVTLDKKAARDHFLGVGIVLITTMISVAVRSELGIATAAMVYLLGVTVISTIGSRRPAILTCILSVASFYYFCVPPYDSFLVLEYS